LCFFWLQKNKEGDGMPSSFFFSGYSAPKKVTVTLLPSPSLFFWLQRTKKGDSNVGVVAFYFFF
jgi:hypothetical protein